MRGAAVVLLLLSLGGCSASPPAANGPYSSQSEQARDTAEAERLNVRAADVMAIDPERADELLREALTADLFFGPAHNNLGVLHLKGGRLYEAASEFEWARKLLPGHPDPRVNLALVFEQAGKTEDALTNYRTALEVYPDYLPALQGAAKLMISTSRRDERLQGWLEDIALRSTDPAWREWARVQMTKRR